MTPPVCHLNLGWEIHLSLVWLSTRSYIGSSLSQCCQDHCCVIHMFKRSLALISLLLSWPSVVINFLPCRPSLCQFRIISYSGLFQICYLFHVIDGGYIKALLWWFLFCRLQLIIQNQDLEILWYLGACMPQWQVSSLSTVGLHHWPLIERFHRLFEFNSLIHTQWIVLEYLGSHWHQWWSPLHLLTVSSMTGNQVVSTMFDFNTCIHMVRFVL